MEEPQGIEDERNFVHDLRLTADQRIAIGGSDVSLSYGREMQRDLNPRVFHDLERDVVRMFPALQGIRFADRWGGPVSVPIDMASAMAFRWRTSMVARLPNWSSSATPI